MFDPFSPHSVNNEQLSYLKTTTTLFSYTGIRGAMVARLTPDQKVACSNHVGVSRAFLLACGCVRLGGRGNAGRVAGVEVASVAQ